MFAIQAITVVDGREDTTNMVRHIVQESVTPNSRGLTTIFSINPDVIEQRIVRDIPHVRVAYVTRQLPGTVRVVVQEKTPSLLLLAQTTYYFVDEAGFAYEQARLDNLPGVIVPIVKSKSAPEDVRLGAPVVSHEFVTFVTDMHQKISDVVQAKTVELYIPSLAAREVSFRLDNNWEVRFDATRSVSEQLSVLQQLLQQTLTDSEKQTLEYIDLRIPNRVYYRTRV
jgi:cell division septal protein FtsQ